MMRFSFQGGVAAALLGVAAPLFGWGFKAHQAINREAVTLLTGSLGAYFSHRIEEISAHAIDPDLWRNDRVGHPNEGEGHYLDADRYGAYPFHDIPRSLDALRAKHGPANVSRWGTAPWRIEDYYRRLVADMRAGRWDEAVMDASALGHYVSDIHVPLHTVENYDGQLTGNRGIHKRWEADMVDLFCLDQFRGKGNVRGMVHPVEEAFRIIAEAFPHHKALLRADSLGRAILPAGTREAIASREASMEGTGYLEILYRETGTLALERMDKATLRVASFWHSAWVEAGRPRPPRFAKKS